MVDFEYESLLERARERIPKNISERSRWTMPEPEVLIEGNQTILRNFSAIVDAMDRDANHVYQFLMNELGTSGTREQVRVLFKGRVPPKRIKEKRPTGYPFAHRQPSRSFSTARRPRISTVARSIYRVLPQNTLA